jgi:hypothetical protein
LDLTADGTSATTFAFEAVDAEAELDVEDALAPPELDELELLLLLLLLLLPQPAIAATLSSGTNAPQKHLHPRI